MNETSRVAQSDEIVRYWIVTGGGLEKGCKVVRHKVRVRIVDDEESGILKGVPADNVVEVHSRRTTKVTVKRRNESFPEHASTGKKDVGEQPSSTEHAVDWWRVIVGIWECASIRTLGASAPS